MVRASGQKTSSGEAVLMRHARGERSQVVYETLRKEILALDLPPSSALDETSLSERFNMSRAPVREALNRLASQNMVVMAPNRTTTVAPLNLQDFPSYADALDLLQRANVRLAATNRSDADIDEMRRLAIAFDACLARYDPIEMSAANKTFHMSVARAGGNRYLVQNYEALLDEGRRLLHLQFRFMRATGTNLPQAKDHHMMVDAIAKRDAAAAEQLAHTHAQEFRRRFIGYLSHSGVGEIDLSGLPGAGYE